MVNGKIDIHRLNPEELSGIVNIYPWFALARRELCARLNGMGACSEAQIFSSALYMNSARTLFDMVRKSRKADCSDAEIRNLVEKYIGGDVEEKPERRVFIAGGDYFSQEQYNCVRKNGDNIFSSFARDIADVEPATVREDESEADVCSETLAGLYVEQGYPDKAKDIYSKLILRYPEKSVYFATLIEKINNN